MRNLWTNVGLGLIGVVLLVYTLFPIYHMFVLALTPTGDQLQAPVWPKHPTLDNFVVLFKQGQFYIQHFWQQLGNSLFAAVTVAVLVLIVGNAASFAIGRLRPRWGPWLSNVALFTYVFPATFLAIPFYKVAISYKLAESIWSLILAMVAFASPYAIWVMRQYSDSIPLSLDEAAKVDGASNWQLLLRIYIPLMAPAMVAVGTYALLLTWNEYLYAFMLLSNETKMTLPVAMGYFLGSDDVPWNLLMATALIYSVPPAVLYYFVRRYMVTGLTAGGVKG